MLKTPLPRLAPPKHHGTNNGKVAMTIAIGMICKNGIVIGADSQFTDSIGRLYSGDKIATIEFSGIDRVLVAEAGLVTFTNRIVAKMRECALKTQITSDQSVTETAEAAIRDLKTQLDPDQWDSGSRSGGAQLLVAFFLKGKPRLYKLDIFGNGVSEDIGATGHYGAIGVGESIADYLLSEIFQVGEHDEAALATMIYVIKKVKDRLKGTCGRETRIKFLWPLPTGLENEYIGAANDAMQKTVNEAELGFSEVDARVRETVRITIPILRATSRRVWDEHLKSVEEETAKRADQNKSNLPPENPNRLR